MNKQKHRTYLAAGVMLIGFWTIPLPYVHGNSDSSKKELDQNQQIARAATLPTSDSVVHLRITVAGQVIKATQREGGLIRIEHEGKIFGVTPHIRDVADNTISVDIFRITTIVKQGGYVGDAIAMVQTLNVNKLTATLTDTAPSLSIQVEGIKPDAIASSEVEKTEASLEKYDRVRKQECCITCGNMTVCSCAVTLSCGSCCSGLCCEDGGGNRPSKTKSN